MILINIFWRLLNMSITAGYVILAVLIVRLLIRRLPKVYSYVLWIIVGFRLLCPVSFSSAYSFFNLQLVNDMERTQENWQYDVLAENEAANGNDENVIYETVETAGEAVYATGEVSVTEDKLPRLSMMTRKELLLGIAAVVWIFGIGIFLIYTVYTLRKVKKKTATAVLFGGNIYECDGIDSPFVFGILRPRIYIPFHLQGKEREYILSHEQYHIHRKDHLVKAVAYLITIVYWFSPLVWISYYLMCQDMEMSCDEKVIGRLGNEVKQSYSRLLLTFATEKRKLAGPLHFGESNVGKRIKNILKFKKAGIAAASLGVVLLIVLCLVFATDGKTKNSVRVTMTNEVPVLSSVIPMEESVQHEYTLEDNIKSYLVYADIYKAGVYGGRKIIACHDVSNYHDDFKPVTGINITSEGDQSTVLIMYNTDMISRTGTFNLPQKASMWATDILWDDGEVREIVPEQPYIYEAKYIGGDTTKELECFFCEHLNQASAEEWDNCINQDCTTILLSFVFSEKPEQDLLKEYQNNDAEAYLIEEPGEGEGEPEETEAVVEETNTENREQPELTLTQVMDRVVEECFLTGKIVDYDDISIVETNGEMGDRMVLLTETEDQSITVYGIVSPEYESRGIIVDYKIDGESNHNYFDWSWNMYQFRPWIKRGDFDQDGDDEVALRLNGARGTGLSTERLLVFEMYSTGHVEPHKLDDEVIDTEIRNLIEERDHPEDGIVDVVEKGTDNILMRISYDMEKEFGKIWYNTVYELLPGGEGDTSIYLIVAPGISVSELATPAYSKERLAFTVNMTTQKVWAAVIFR